MAVDSSESSNLKEQTSLFQRLESLLALQEKDLSGQTYTLLMQRQQEVRHISRRIEAIQKILDAAAYSPKEEHTPELSALRIKRNQLRHIVLTHIAAVEAHMEQCRDTLSERLGHLKKAPYRRRGETEVQPRLVDTSI